LDAPKKYKYKKNHVKIIIKKYFILSKLMRIFF